MISSFDYYFCSMRKSITIVFVMFYVLVSLGPTFTLHYCGGQFESINLFGSTNTCCCGGNTINTSCCENHVLHYQPNDEQRLGQEFRIFSSPLVDINFQPLFNLVIINTNIEPESENPENSPPPPEKERVWIKNCSLIFYA